VDKSFDLVVIGTGAAASTVANRCRGAGWSVAIIDELPFGGTCQLRGCDPKKMLRRAAEVVDAARLMRRLYFQLGLSGETGEATEVLDQAIDLLADLPPGPVLAELYASRSEAEMFAGRSEASLDWAARALSSTLSR